MSIRENIQRVQARIEHACLKSGRRPEEIRLIAVTKSVEVPQIEAAIEAGIREIGENRVQEALPKFDKIKAPVTWHMIGHLQTNKVNKALEFADMIQSVDSLRLAEAIQKRADRLDRDIEVLVEVNTSGEASKFGFAPEEVVSAVEEIAHMPRLRVKGLMTIGAFLPDPEDVRPCFVRLRHLREQIRERSLPHVDLEILSMGMTDDFEVAIEEGSTMVRVGRAIFGDRPE